MIQHVHGDLLTADVEALVNVVNCVGVMGKGLALQFKQTYPENYKEYVRACQNHELQFGKMLIVPTHRATNPKYIVNFPTKYHWREESRIEHIQSGLDALVNDIIRLSIHSIALPALGCGLGGLAWAEVASRIEAAFAPLANVHALLYMPV